ncbi:GDYXXLXY domain-containing protein [Castellaniella caeni]|uniref:GDYXXLXY domain-containing protein n=1 Tax=Castellaniella caeni TaxID=266123 RepID=UPI00082B90E7|nr:GDYXXLXY domain-containing protein [Castellaniella caeni]
MQVTEPGAPPLSPAPWRQELAQGLAWLAALLGGTALLSWVAANWPQMGANARLALVQGVLAVLVLLAAGLAWRASRWASLVASLAAVATGALLALIGQIYQTGADAWQLFAVWAVLVVPWLACWRAVPLVLLWVALLNLALWAYTGAAAASIWWRWPESGSGAAASALVLLNGALLAAAEGLRAWLPDRWRIVRRVLAAVLLGWAFGAAVQAVSLDAASRIVPPLLVGLVPTLAVYAAYAWWRRDAAVVALALLAGIGVLGVASLPVLDSIDAALGLAVLLLLLGLWAVRHVLRLRQASRDGLSAASVPWYLTVLRVGVLVPVVLLLGVWLAASFDLTSAGDALLVAVLLVVPALWLDRGTASALGHEVGAVLAVLGVLLAAVAALVLMDADAHAAWRLPVVLVFGLCVYVGLRQPVVRLLTAWLTLLAALWLISPLVHDFGWQADAQGVGTAHLAVRLWFCLALGVGLWVWALRADHRAAWRPLAWALMAVAALLAGLIEQWAGVSAWDGPWDGLAALWLCALLPGLLLGARLATRRPAPSASLRLGLPLALCAASLGWIDIPALSVALTGLVLGRLTRHRPLMGLSVALGVCGLAAYYLNAANGVSLVAKATQLAVTAAWLAGVALILWRRNRGAPLASEAKAVASASRQSWRALVCVLGGVLVLGMAQAQVYRHQAILTQGQPVILALAPVDPRSLLQGDYMALDYAVRQSAIGWLRGHPQVQSAVQASGRGWLVLRVDAQGVAQLQAVSPAPPVALPPDVHALAFHWRGARPDWGASSWLFPEGQGARYAAARYGVLRVMPDGRALLAGLLDARQKPL